MDLQTVHDEARRIAREAGGTLLSYLGNTRVEDTKANVYDIVTEADRQVEAMIVSALLDAFPDTRVIGEEGGSGGAAEADYCWYIDPIDGTTNFANAIPYFSISIALADRTMTPLVGVVYHPVADELFTAITGQGARLNGRPIHVSGTGTLDESVVATGFPYDKHTNPDNNLNESAAFTGQTRGVRRMGSAALDLSYVAAGRFEGYWEQRLNPWDLLAGVLCVMEAGGRVTDYEGADPPDIYRVGMIAASNGRIHDAMLGVLAQARAGL